MTVGFTTSEAEFISESEMISITPSSKIPKLEMMELTFGPFRPLVKTDVPLWLAIALKKANKCNIQPPEWMDLDYLQSILDQEEALDSILSPLPFHYLEISHLLLTSASDDIPRSEQIKTLLKDIRIIRQKKINKSLNNLDHYSLETTNMSMMELQEVRPFFTNAFNELKRLNPETDQDAIMT